LLGQPPRLKAGREVTKDELDEAISEGVDL